MKVRHPTPHLYLDMQRGGHYPIFRGVRKRGGLSLRFLKPLVSMVGKSVFRMGKKVAKKAAPELLDTALEAGRDIMKGKKIKHAAKTALSRTAKSLGRTTRESLEEELRQHGKKHRGGGLVYKRTQKLKKRS